MTESITFDQLYPAGHSYPHTYESTKYFCPHCGRKEVWQEFGPGDYYEGPDILCTYCGGSFGLPFGDSAEADSDGSPTRGPLHWIREKIGWAAK